MARKNLSLLQSQYFAKPTIGLTAVLMLSACANLVEKGDKLYEQGLYKQAAEFYQKALNENPEDLEAKQGLASARTKIIDRGLIEVRMLRLASNYRGAASKLEQLITNQNQWHVETMGAQAASQKEEVKAVESWLRSEAKQLAQHASPDPFMWFETEFSNLIANAQLGSEFQQYRPRLAQAGVAQCSKLSEQVSGQRFFLKQFAQRYCAVWQQTPKLTVDKTDTTRYQQLQVVDRIDFDTPQYKAHNFILEGAISQFENSLQISPWFSANSTRKLKMSLDASVDYDRKTSIQKKQKRYIVREFRQDPNNKDKQVQVELERAFSYQQTEYRERYALSIKYQANMAGRLLVNSETGNQSNTTYSHNYEFSEAGVSPKYAEFLTQQSYFQSHLDNLHNKFQSDLNRAWRDKYCVQAVHEHLAESALRCAVLEPNNAFVNSWFRQSFGVDYAAMKVLYGI